ncbi:serine/threonine protein kinase [Thiolapillus brandeum]|uniref:Protein kinase domain-containing protein n=1 Tax=Thiolapillus brandeum TaxID=1076588 RepID=A0A7U6JHX3_9GAMM|nr:serine/threonine-protein kinase [Thiolapillus brandeum]BAO43645.1 hypothetical protein TBH_C0707 [Thiolapillus brandeum]
MAHDQTDMVEGNTNMEFPGYKMIRQLGEGGQARVYLAKQLSFNRNVAIKILDRASSAEEVYVESFLQEARMVAGLSHPHIIPVYDFGNIDGHLYLVMEYCVGGDLKALMKSGMVADEVFKIMAEIASALAFSHDRGVFHLDIKPENIMFRQDNSAVLMDFGIAQNRGGKSMRQELGKILGTPSYMSPEQLLSEETDGRADVYALGIVFYEMLTGQLPYQADDIVQLAKKHAFSPIPKLPAQFGKYQLIFEKLVAKDPADRYQTALEVAKIFQNITNGVDDPEVLSGATAVPYVASAKDAGISQDIAEVEDADFLHDLHPLLDKDWEQRLSALFQELSESKREYIYERILVPKGIVLDASKTNFVYMQVDGVDNIARQLTFNALKMLCAKLQRVKKDLESMQDVMAIADIMESSLSQIAAFDCQDNMELQMQKIQLRNAWVNDLIQYADSKHFDIPDNQRDLNNDVVKTYMLDVFLRHQVLGYRFRTYSVEKLKEHEDAFLRDTVAREARVRQCELVVTGKYLFMIGTVKDVSQNQFSIRRFLSEESVMNGEYIFFNAVAIPLEELDSKQVVEKCEWSISRIFTLERQLSASILDIVKDMKRAQQDILAPLLQKDVKADGTDLESSIENRLITYEKELTLNVLGKLASGVRMLAKTPDDMEYLFINARKLLTGMAADVRSFHMKPALSWSQAAEEMELKIIAYLHLMEKRYASLFVPGQPKDDDGLMDSKQCIQEFKDLIADSQIKLKASREKLKQAQERQSKQEQSSMYRVLSGFKDMLSKPVVPEQIEFEIETVKKECLVGIIKISKRHTQIVVHLEFEGLVEFDESKRHYALPAGEMGLSRLPILILLYEDASILNMDSVLNRLNYDVLRRFPSNATVARASD